MIMGEQPLMRRVRALVQRFRDEIGYQRRLELSAPYYPFRPEYLHSDYPGAGEPGVYIYSSGGDVLYVGKCARHMGIRIWSHLGRRGGPDEADLYPNCKDWARTAGQNLALRVVTIDKGHWYLSSALEGFLIESLSPLHNAKGRRS